MHKSLAFVACTLLANTLSSQTPNQAPLISNFVASADWPNNTLTLTYDLFDEENDPVEISLAFSSDGGQTYNLTPLVSASGDWGFPVATGTNRAIVCDISALAPMQSAAFTVRLVADDKQNFDIQALVEEVDSLRLRDDLAFVEGIRHRVTGLTHLNAVRDELRQHFDQLGLALSEQTFTYLGATGRNIIGTLSGTGTSEKVVIVDAHYDTVNNSPGADDNGSGVAGVMEVARILSRYPSKKTLRYIGFDMEEDGLRGSLAYVGSLPPNEQVEGVFNFEMIGYYSEEPNTQDIPPGFNLIFPDATAQINANQRRGDFITNVANANCEPLALLFSSAAAEFVPDLKVVTLISPGNGTLVADLLRSDHAPFWFGNKPALMLTDGADYRNDCYHTPQDMADDKLNFTFMANVVKATVAAVAQLAEIQHGDWATTTFQGTTQTWNPSECSVAIWHHTSNADVLSLTVSNCLFTSANVEIMDENGRLLHSEVLRLNGHEQQHSMHFPRLPSGIYFAKITWPSGMRTQKFVVAR